MMLCEYIFDLCCAKQYDGVRTAALSVFRLIGNIVGELVYGAEVFRILPQEAALARASAAQYRPGFHRKADKRTRFERVHLQQCCLAQLPAEIERLAVHHTSTTRSARQLE